MELTAPLRTPPRKNARDGCGRVRSEQSATSATRSARCRCRWRGASPPGREPPAIAPPAPALLVPRDDASRRPALAGASSNAAAAQRTTKGGQGVLPALFGGGLVVFVRDRWSSP